MPAFQTYTLPGCMSPPSSFFRLLIAKSAQGSELCRAIEVSVSRDLEACPQPWQTASLPQHRSVNVRSECAVSVRHAKAGTSPRSIPGKPQGHPHPITSDMCCLRISVSLITPLLIMAFETPFIIQREIICQKREKRVHEPVERNLGACHLYKGSPRKTKASK